jgi:hypothetical protein
LREWCILLHLGASGWKNQDTGRLPVPRGGHIRLRKNTSLSKGAVVRGRDENSGEIAAGVAGMRFFSRRGSCALRVAGAHQNVREHRPGQELT